MKRLIVFLLFTFIIAFKALASSFYSAKVVVEGDNKQAENIAKQQGFKDVLVRVSGKRGTLDLPEIRTSLSRVNQYINQVSYEIIDGKRVGNYLYDNRKILELLKKAKASFWDVKRPNVLFWLVNSDSDRILWAEYVHPEIDQIRAAGIRRGLPISLPTGDIEDMLSIDPKDLLGNVVSSIKQASIKYNPEGVVVAKIQDSTLSWQFFPSFEQMEEGHSLDGKEENSIDQMIDAVSDYYANELAINMEVEETKLLNFALNGVDKAADYFLAEKMLRQLNSVISVGLKSVVKDTIIFDLVIYDSSDTFLQELTKYEQMEPAPIEPEPLSISSHDQDVEIQEEASNENELAEEQIHVETFTYQWLGHFNEEVY